MAPKPLFLIGNKRSGTSHFVRVLNLHPQIFVSHESDVIWILYQWSRRQPFSAYQWDGGVGMDATLASCGHLLPQGDARERPAVAELFVAMQHHLMMHGSAVQAPHASKRDVAWLGDKKPVQHADPEIHRFIRTHFPDARCLHLIRHPRATVASMVKAGLTWAKVDYWNNGTAQTIVNRWVIHEEWVLAVKAANVLPVLTVRFEDFIAAPAEELRKICAFLDVDLTDDLARVARLVTRREINEKYRVDEIPVDARSLAVMDTYGYSWTL